MINLFGFILLIYGILVTISLMLLLSVKENWQESLLWIILHSFIMPCAITLTIGRLLDLSDEDQDGNG
jgi:hypothetical protein